MFEDRTGVIVKSKLERHPVNPARHLYFEPAEVKFLLQESHTSTLISIDYDLELALRHSP
jgi:hypothetical protein